MTYVVTENCIKCKYTDCVVVCPVDCFHEGENMLVINPQTCIDCGVCEPECPAGAIRPQFYDEADEMMLLNAKMAAIWPNLTQKKQPLENAEEAKNEKDKFKYFSENPGTGS